LNGNCPIENLNALLITSLTLAHPGHIYYDLKLPDECKEEVEDGSADRS
jgi:hypothetical protein